MRSAGLRCIGPRHVDEGSKALFHECNQYASEQGKIGRRTSPGNL